MDLCNTDCMSVMTTMFYDDDDTDNHPNDEPVHIPVPPSVNMGERAITVPAILTTIDIVIIIVMFIVREGWL